MKQVIEHAIKANTARDEQIIRSLLGRWVSELVPAIAYDQFGAILGLVPANSPIGSKPFMLRVEKTD
jgi:hypothetical protein